LKAQPQIDVPVRPWLARRKQANVSWLELESGGHQTRISEPKKAQPQVNIAVDHGWRKSKQVLDWKAILKWVITTRTLLC